MLPLQDLEAMEQKTVEALNGLEGELKGTYYPLTGMDKETQEQLTNDHFLFKDDDRSVSNPLHTCTCTVMHFHCY